MVISVINVFEEAKNAFISLLPLERFVHTIWLLGPFVLLIERSPADAWITFLAAAFLVRSIKTRDFSWFSAGWVRYIFVFWIICGFSAIFSENSLYSLGEAIIWFRFPLFAMATVFWLGEDMRLLRLMLFTTFAAVLIMCGILISEIFLEGLKWRLSWPYDDLVPGNFLAKVGLPVVVFSSTLALSSNGPRSLALAGFCTLTLFMALMTGERINFLILLCAVLLTIFVWEPRWSKRIMLIGIVTLLVCLAFQFFPGLSDRFVQNFLDELPFKPESDYYKAMVPAWFIFTENPLLGIGPGNFRYLCSEMVPVAKGLQCHNHPHNFYLQLLAEVGALGFVSGCLFIFSIVAVCFRASIGQQHFLYKVSWIMPFAVFWPIRSSADFFGQWNNIFLWSGVAIALAVAYQKLRNPGQP